MPVATEACLLDWGCAPGAVDCAEGLDCNPVDSVHGTRVPKQAPSLAPARTVGIGERCDDEHLVCPNGAACYGTCVALPVVKVPLGGECPTSRDANVECPLGATCQPTFGCRWSCAPTCQPWMNMCIEQ